MTSTGIRRRTRRTIVEHRGRVRSAGCGSPAGVAGLRNAGSSFASLQPPIDVGPDRGQGDFPRLAFLEGLQLTGVDELIASRQADAEQAAGLGEADDEGSKGGFFFKHYSFPQLMMTCAFTRMRAKGRNNLGRR